MRTAFITHPDCLGHDIGHDHPESPSRLRAIDDRLHAADLYHFLRHYDAPQVTREQLLRVHDGEYLDELERMQPETDIVQLDQDTALMSKSLLAARRAAGAVIMGVELVTAGEVNNVFCCVRPPGHHAEHNRAMGFCIYANAAIGAAHALNSLGLERVAVVDFDVHHGNGTEALFRDDERVMVCSTFQHPFYPDTPFEENGTRIINVPLKAGSTGGDFKE
ncbi:MAG: histone deacetylase family protein, partial [Gammaproteobacteria bacterium]|nr:histone deacetylase family protein [Gammaproteobacteria bacterium]